MNTVKFPWNNLFAKPSHKKTFLKVHTRPWNVSDPVTSHECNINNLSTRSMIMITFDLCSSIAALHIVEMYFHSYYFALTDVTICNSNFMYIHAMLHIHVGLLYFSDLLLHIKRYHFFGSPTSKAILWLFLIQFIFPERLPSSASQLLDWYVIDWNFRISVLMANSDITAWYFPELATGSISTFIAGTGRSYFNIY